MRPIELRLYNVCQHGEATLKFQPGITGIVGPNGHGKSNLVDTALFFAITGKTNDRYDKGKLLKWGTTGGRTEFDFEHDGI